MHTLQPELISNFFVAGINHLNADAATRGRFAVNNEQYADLLALAPSFGIDAFFVLSTCNRTEIYGFAETAAQLIRLLCTQVVGEEQDFTDKAYIKSGTDSVHHLFRVGAGLDSQLLGDYEIIGQIKRAVEIARESHAINCFLDRLVNTVLLASKRIKNETVLSSGSVSVAFTAVQYIKQHYKVGPSTKILMIGTGNMGRATSKNLVDCLGTTNITLMNRSFDKAAELALELKIKHAPIRQLHEHLKSANIILTATSSAQPAISRHQLLGMKDKLIIDLSIPYNVDAAAGDLPGITLINVESLSLLKDQTLQQRLADVPKAEIIIRQEMEEFVKWHLMRKNAAVLKAVKLRLNEIDLPYRPIEVRGLSFNTELKIQTVLNKMANKMRSQNQHGCQYIEAINDFMEAPLCVLPH